MTVRAFFRRAGFRALPICFLVQSVGAQPFQVLHSFVGSDGAQPPAELLADAAGNLYGTTQSGGPSNYGSVFMLDASNGYALTTLHFFASSEGTQPLAGLIADPAGNLYGTTYDTGGLTDGTVFKLDASNGYALTTLHSFSGPDGFGPTARLLMDPAGNLYGTAAFGGMSNNGTVFKLDASNGYALTTLHYFTGSDGSWPFAGLLADLAGNLYGTTGRGGTSANCTNGCGTVFKLDASNGYALTTLHSFDGSDGSDPVGALIADPAGNLYSTTNTGAGGCGSMGCGTVFELDASNGYALTTLHHFTLSDGAFPKAGLLADLAGNVYGTTYGGGAHVNGTAFELVAASGWALTTLHDFNGSDGLNPTASLIADSLGNLYGTTSDGASTNCPYGCGTVFRILLCTVNPPPQITPSGPTTFCQGGSVTLDAGAGYASYLWSPNGETTQTIVVTASGSYSVTVTDANGCMGTSAPVAVTVNANPTPAITPSGPTTFCQGGNVVLDAGSGYVSYSWSPNGETTQTITVSASGSYSVTVTDVNGCAGTSSPAAVTVNSNPSPVVTVTQCLPPNTSGNVASASGSAGDTYAWTISGGTIDSGQGTSLIFFTSGANGQFMTLSVTETNSSNCSGTANSTMQVDFADVPPSNPFYNFVCMLARNSITGGCGGGNYCPSASVLRSQMAVFLLRAEHGPSYMPPACTNPIFTDVPCSNPFSSWIYQLVAEGISNGCTTTTFCPNDAVLRNSMAVFLLVTEHGTGYTPPACTPPGQFTDVPCPGGGFTNWIYELVAEGITGGCTATAYCPSQPVSRAQMSVFLVTTFSLP
jgi:uncharacterized repeat protein (TIGR03803 family)